MERIRDRSHSEWLGSLAPEKAEVIREATSEFLKDYGESLKTVRGDFSLVSHFFVGGGEKNLVDELRRRRLELSDAEFSLSHSLGYKVDPNKFDRVSKSPRVVNGIDVYKKGGDTPVLRLYVKVLDTHREVDCATTASSKGWSPKVYNTFFISKDKNVGGVVEHTRSSGFIVEERMPKGNSIRKVGNRFDRKDAEIFGRILAEKVRSMLDSDEVFRFSNLGSTHLRIVPSENLHDPLFMRDGSDESFKPVYSLPQLYKRIQNATDDDLKHHLFEKNDFSRWTRLSIGNTDAADSLDKISFNEKNPEKTRNELLNSLRHSMYGLKFLGVESYRNIGGDFKELKEELTGMLRTVMVNIGSRVRHHAIRGFRDSFIGPQPPAGDQYSTERKDYEDRVRAFDGARNKLEEINGKVDYDSKAYWDNVFEHVDNPAMAPSVNEEDDAYAYMVGELESKGIRRGTGRAIAKDLYLNLVGKGLDPSDTQFRRVEAGGDTVIQVVDTAQNPLTRYVLSRPHSDRLSNMRRADHNGVSPPLIMSGERDVLLYPLELKFDEVENNEFKRAEAAKSIGKLVSGCYKSFELPSQIRLDSIVFSESEEYGTRAFFTNWGETKKLSKKGTIKKIEDLKDYLVENADEIKKIGGPPSWKAFKKSFIDDSFTNLERSQLEEMFKGVETKLREKSVWANFLEEAEKSIIKRELFHRKQTGWLDRLRDTPTLTHYHPKQLNRCKELEPVIEKAIYAVFKAHPGHFEDPVVDVRHVHLAVKGDENSLVDAKLGNLDISSGNIIFELYDLENTRRGRRLTGVFMVPYSKGKIFAPERITEEQLTEKFKIDKLVSPAAFKVHLRPNPDGMRDVGGSKYDFQWNENFYSEPSSDISDLRKAVNSRSVGILSPQAKTKYSIQLNGLRREGQVEVAWEKSIQHIVMNNPNWYELLDEILTKRESLPKAERVGFVLECEKRLDPQHPEFLADGRKSYDDFTIYQRHPTLMDVKAQKCFPRLKERLETFFTLEDAMPFVFAEEEKKGQRMFDVEQTNFLAKLEAEGEVKRVKLNGIKPSEFVKDIKYLEDTRHTTYLFTVETEDKKLRKVVVKDSDLMCEVLPATVLMNIRGRGNKPLIRTPLITAVDPQYSLMSFMEGTQVRDLSQKAPEVLKKFRNSLFFKYGAHSKVSHCCGDGHGGNVNITNKGEFIRFDTEDVELLDRVIVPGILVGNQIGRENIGCHPYKYELAAVRHLIGWDADRETAWKQYTDGIQHAHRQLNKPGVRENIFGFMDKLSKIYPVERTGLTDDYMGKVRQELSMDPDVLIEGITLYGYAMTKDKGDGSEAEFFASKIPHFERVKYLFEDGEQRLTQRFI